MVRAIRAALRENRFLLGAHFRGCRRARRHDLRPALPKSPVDNPCQGRNQALLGTQFDPTVVVEVFLAMPATLWNELRENNWQAVPLVSN